MKIDNNGLPPISPKKITGSAPVEKKPAKNEAQAASQAAQGKDRADLSESARLLAKARAELEDSAQVENERLELLRAQIESGAYEVPVEELARRMAARLFRKE